MTYKSYSKGLQYIFAVLGVLLFIQQFGKGFIDCNGWSFVCIANYYAIRLLVLYLLFFSVYALLSKIKELRKLESPIIFILFGLFLVIVLFGPPLYIYARGNGVQSATNQLQVSEVREEALNRNNISGKRYMLVQNHYINSGERLAYLDENGREVVYSPNQTTIQLYESRQALYAVWEKVEATAINNIIMIVASTICFVMLIWYRFGRSLE